MKTTIQKWGNSLALRIPKNISEETGLTEGATVELSAYRNKITIRKKNKKKYQLDDLLNGINANNLHSEVDFGKPEGKEIL